MSFEIKTCMLTNNDCYKKGATMKPLRIVVHSTGANNKYIKRYVQPDDGILGVNKYNNHWNKSGVDKCVHAFIGMDKNDTVRIYQTLPWTMKPWGCGVGKSGSYNNSAIQFEICEDALTDIAYFTATMQAAADLCAYLCAKYDIPVTEVVSHHEAHVRGFASNHGDIDHWLKRFSKTMDWFRGLVSQKLAGADLPHYEVKPVATSLDFKVKVTASSLNIRAGAGIGYKVVGAIKDKGVYTIVEQSGNWGRLKSGAGWISLLYTKRV